MGRAEGEKNHFLCLFCPRRREFPAGIGRGAGAGSGKTDARAVGLAGCAGLQLCVEAVPVSWAVGGAETNTPASSRGLGLKVGPQDRRAPPFPSGLASRGIRWASRGSLDSFPGRQDPCCPSVSSGSARRRIRGVPIPKRCFHSWPSWRGSCAVHCQGRCLRHRMGPRVTGCHNCCRQPVPFPGMATVSGAAGTGGRESY